MEQGRREEEFKKEPRIWNLLGNRKPSMRFFAPRPRRPHSNLPTTTHPLPPCCGHRVGASMHYPTNTFFEYVTQRRPIESIYIITFFYKEKKTQTKPTILASRPPHAIPILRPLPPRSLLSIHYQVFFFSFVLIIFFLLSI